MATGHLKILEFIPAAGTRQFSVPLLAFTRLVEVKRENIVHYIHFTRTITAVEDKGVLFNNLLGRLTFKSDALFTGSEKVFIIYKDRLI